MECKNASFLFLRLNTKRRSVKQSKTLLTRVLHDAAKDMCNGQTHTALHFYVDDCLLMALTPSFIGIHICIDTVQLCAWAANRGIYVSNAFYLAPVGPGGSFQHPSASR